MAFRYLAVQRVASDGSASGAPAMFATGADEEPTPFLAASRLGFLLAGEANGDGANGGDVYVRQLSSTLAPIADPVDLGMRFWFHGAIAASETSVAVNVAKPYGAMLFVLDLASGTITSTHDLSGGGKGVERRPGRRRGLLRDALGQ